jgi:hypothetical protein
MCVMAVDMTNVSDRHHFDNPAYGSAGAGGGRSVVLPGSSSGGCGGGALPIHGSPMPLSATGSATRQRLLNNSSSRVVNHLSNCDAAAAAGLKNVNSERERLSAVATAARYVVREGEEDEDSMSDRGGFGCTGNAFGYTTLSNRKNLEADANNPNLYCSIDDLKDNRRLENMYDEIQKKASAASMAGKGNTISI